MAPDPRPRRGRRAATRLLVVDDHPLVRAGLRGMLTGERGLEVVGEAASGAEALELVRRLRPDLVLMDVRMPEMDGLATTRAIKREFPMTGVLIVTTHASPEYLFEALKAGAAGYVLKDAAQRDVVRAVRTVLSGGEVLPPELAQQLLRRLAGDVGGSPAVGQLTPREREVLAQLGTGRTNRQIAEALVLSPGTVKVHVERIIAKLGVSDRTQAVVRAWELGLLRSAD